jgi:L-ascorbate metabolism protein UlaG (beta-lactamase superfamily)
VDITWYGHSCFRIAERGSITLLTDPYGPELGLPPLKPMKAEVVTISHDRPGHNYMEAVKSPTLVARSPGEYEVGGVFINGIAMHTITEDVVLPNVAYRIQYGALRVLHLGDLARVPDQQALEDLLDVNVLLIPVGGGAGLKANVAAEVVSLIEPNYIIPMHYALPGLAVELDPVDKFLKEMGVTKVQEEDVLKLTVANLPEQPQVIVLRPQFQVNGG